MRYLARTAALLNFDSLIRFNFIHSLFDSNESPVLLVGKSCTGKTISMESTLKKRQETVAWFKYTALKGMDAAELPVRAL